MNREWEEQRAILEDIADESYNHSHPSQASALHCEECGCVLSAVPVSRDGLCQDCRDTLQNERRAQEDRPEPTRRVVELGDMYDAVFVGEPVNELTVYRSTHEHPLSLVYFDPADDSDELLAHKVRTRIVFS